LRRDREVEQGQYGSVAVDIVDVREAGGPDDGPHGDHRNLLCTFEVAHQLMSRRQKRAKGTTLRGVAVGWANREAPRIPRKVARTPMPLVLNQSSRSLQNLKSRRLRHVKSPRLRLLKVKLN
jgi:hypothetical protein